MTWVAWLVRSPSAKLGTMRRAVALAKLLQPAGLQQAAALSAAAPATAPRCFSAAAGGGHHHPAVPSGPPTPLQKIVPMIIEAVPATFKTAQKQSIAALNALLTSGATRGVLGAFADRVLLPETFLGLDDVDVPKWAAWLAAGGYRNPAGWDKIVAHLKPRVAQLKPAEVAAVAHALFQVDRYDKELFKGLAAAVQEHFTEFDTESLARLAHAFASHDHYSVDLFDDIADGIAYCNHYFSPMTLSQNDLARVFGAYAKYGHDRADAFVPLARAINEDKLLELENAELHDAVMTYLRAFNKLEFWPDATEGLFVVSEKRPAAFQESEKAEIQAIVQKVEAYAGGHLTWYRGGYKDPEHFEGAVFSNYNLWVFRDELVPDSYKPTDVKVLKE